MKIKILQSIASPDIGYLPGLIYDLDADIAGKWISRGICVAEPDEMPAVEPENANKGASTVEAKKTRKKS
jgi:hypothetical protein